LRPNRVRFATQRSRGRRARASSRRPTACSRSLGGSLTRRHAQWDARRGRIVNRSAEPLSGLTVRPMRLAGIEPAESSRPGPRLSPTFRARARLLPRFSLPV
jgi:hypothetical protein